MVYQAKTNQENRKREEKDIEAAQQLTVRFLSYRSRSSEEVRNKLAERGFSPRTIQKAIARIKELGYLKDYDYAQEATHADVLGPNVTTAMNPSAYFSKNISIAGNYVCTAANGLCASSDTNDTTTVTLHTAQIANLTTSNRRVRTLA